MAVRSGFWNSSGSDIRRYYNSDFSHLISLLINDGVSQNYGESLIPTTGAGMTVVIQTGEAWFNDIWLRNDTDLVVDIDAAPIVSGYSRLDAIAIKIDASSGVRDGTIVYVPGTPTAGTPTLPAMVDTADVHWHMLASVLVKTNDTSIPRERIANYVGSNTTPLITGLLETVSTEDLIQQWQAEFNSWNSNKQAEFEAWVKTIQGILDKEAAGHLQLEIEDLYSKTHTNLLNPTLQTTTVNGVTCTANGDGTYTLTGTATAHTDISVTPWGTSEYANLIQLEPNKKYKIIGSPSGNSVSTYFMCVVSNNGTTRNNIAWDYNNDGVFTSLDSAYHYEIKISVTNGTTLPSGGLTFKPMLTTDTSATYDDFVQYSGPGEINENVAEIFNTFFDIMHPVGDLYITKNASFNPNTAKGWKGTWERDKGRFVRLAGDNDAIGSTGGSDTRTLTAANLPSHYHEMQNHTHYIPALSGSTGNPTGGNSLASHVHGTLVDKSSSGGGRSDWGLTAAGAFGGNVLLARGVGGANTSLPTQGPDYVAHGHSVTTNASTTGGPSNNQTTSTGSGTAFDNRPFHENFYGWVRIA